MVLLSLCDRMGETADGSYACFPHVAVIGEDLHTSERHIWRTQKAIREKYPNLLRYDACPQGGKLETHRKGRKPVNHRTPRWTWTGDTIHGGQDWRT